MYSMIIINTCQEHVAGKQWPLLHLTQCSVQSFLVAHPSLAHIHDNWVFFTVNRCSFTWFQIFICLFWPCIFSLQYGKIKLRSLNCCKDHKNYLMVILHQLIFTYRLKQALILAETATQKWCRGFLGSWIQVDPFHPRLEFCKNK